MKIREVMSESVHLGEPSTSLRKAAEIMSEGDFGILPIQKDDRLVGMVTDRDIAIRGVAQGKDTEKTTCGEIMTDKVFYCFDDQNQKEIADMMSKNMVRRMPVVNREKRLVGIVSLGDLANEPETQEAAKETLQQVSQHSHA